MLKRIDLHLHTTASDGSDTPAELVSRAGALGIDVIAVTDHDTLAGSAEAIKLSDDGVEIITGIEFSCHHHGEGGFDCHILGYGFDPDSPALLDAIAHGREMRLAKLEARLRYLRESFGISFCKDDLDWLHSLNSAARPHLAGLLVKRGYALDMAAAMDTYLKGDGFPDDRIDAGEALAAIEAAGGISVYAHPIGGEREKRLTRDELLPRVKALSELGLRGLECYYSRYSSDDEKMLVSLATDMGLLVSGGSDYHGENKTVRLGALSSDGSEIDVSEISVLSALCSETDNHFERRKHEIL